MPDFLNGNSPITWNSLLGVVKGAVGFFGAAAVVLGGWAALGLPVPAKQQDLLGLERSIGTRFDSNESFQRETRVLVLLVKKNSAHERLADIEDRQSVGERSPDLRLRKVSLQREIDALDRQIAKLERISARYDER